MKSDVAFTVLCYVIIALVLDLSRWYPSVVTELLNGVHWTEVLQPFQALELVAVYAILIGLGLMALNDRRQNK